MCVCACVCVHVCACMCACYGVVFKVVHACVGDVTDTHSALSPLVHTVHGSNDRH